MSDMPPMKTKTSRSSWQSRRPLGSEQEQLTHAIVSEKRVGAYQPVVTMGFWMMGKLKTRIVIGYIFA
jgi:hypothetical protein